jgi:hypothetical protein
VAQPAEVDSGAANSVGFIASIYDIVAAFGRLLKKGGDDWPQE